MPRLYHGSNVAEYFANWRQWQDECLYDSWQFFFFIALKNYRMFQKASEELRSYPNFIILLDIMNGKEEALVSHTKYFP